MPDPTSLDLVLRFAAANMPGNTIEHAHRELNRLRSERKVYLAFVRRCAAIPSDEFGLGTEARAVIAMTHGLV